MPAQIPRYIPLSEAVRRYDLDPGVLTSLIEDGRIGAVQTNDNIVVAEEDVSKTQETMTKRDEFWRRVQHLDGKPIGINEASNKYGFGYGSLYTWINRGYLRVLENRRGGGRGRKRTLNEADVAYAALVAEHRGQTQGRSIFTEAYIPPHLDSE
jgi:predicted site-specific integrase-resolvase